jgi:segregation and condensation protein A
VLQSSTNYYNQNYQVDTDLYQGPLDLLLQLIEKAELDITKLSIAKVTDQFLDYLNRLENENPAEVSSFLVIATRLVHIKSQALLPAPPILSPGEEEEDAGEELARQLRIYKKFKEISVFLLEREQEGLRTYLRLAPPPKIKFQPKIDLSEVSLTDLVQVAREIFSRTLPLQDLDTIITSPRITIRERINAILGQLRDFPKTTFSHLIKQRNSRLELVVTFLALLELVKRHIIKADQNELFGDIHLKAERELDDELELDVEFSE